jgi:hypothetical protein
MITKLKQTMSKTKFPDAPIIGVAANNPSFETQFIDEHSQFANSVGVNRLIETLKSYVVEPDSKLQHRAEDFLFAFDHCFIIKG